MKRIIVFSFISVFFLFLSGITTFAQEWSAEQKDVWAGVEKYWQADTDGNTQDFLTYFDESYSGWNNQSRVPQNKANTAKWIKNDSADNTTLLHAITPLTIWVKDNFAFVHYTFSQISKNNESGKKTPSAGIWTDILMKKDGKWLLVGDHGGRTTRASNSEN